MAFWIPLIAGGSVVAGVGSFFFGEEKTGELVEGAIDRATDGLVVIMEAVVPAFMEGVLGGVEGVIESFKGREVAFFTGLTVATLSYVAFRSIKQMTAIPVGGGLSA